MGKADWLADWQAKAHLISNESQSIPLFIALMFCEGFEAISRIKRTLTDAGLCLFSCEDERLNLMGNTDVSLAVVLGLPFKPH